MKRVTVKRLRELLDKYVDDAVVMIGVGERQTEGMVIYDLDEDPSYAYRDEDGDIIEDVSPDQDESFSKYDRVVVLWSTNE